MLTKELLEKYMKQNPKKYMKKFGGKTHEQILAEEQDKINKKLDNYEPPKPEVAVEFKEVKQVETSFAPSADAETSQINQVVEERIVKRARKVANAY